MSEGGFWIPWCAASSACRGHVLVSRLVPSSTGSRRESAFERGAARDIFGEPALRELPGMNPAASIGGGTPSTKSLVPTRRFGRGIQRLRHPDETGGLLHRSTRSCDTCLVCLVGGNIAPLTRRIQELILACYVARTQSNR